MPTLVRPEYAPAVMQAIANLKRDGVPFGIVSWVNPLTGEAFETVPLPAYDALLLAKDMEFNGRARGDVAELTYVTPAGNVLDTAAIKAAKF